MEKRGEDTSAIEAQIEANKAASIALDAQIVDDAAKLVEPVRADAEPLIDRFLPALGLTTLTLLGIAWVTSAGRYLWGG